jgi:hypothetical protein
LAVEDEPATTETLAISANDTELPVEPVMPMDEAVKKSVTAIDQAVDSPALPSKEVKASQAGEGDEGAGSEETKTSADGPQIPPKA